ncbi:MULTISPECIES: phosphatase PAP2 family protein [Xanthomonas]|uniref:undecaprenyl-diphosphate phosphatase n=1 Tax=Xanthomonas cucurbitae TaxID=56453 RepID=A0ABY7Y7V7_9XANT|nr:phosphatase PAP2 family protein [Xanthomonas cucurbitae]WDM66063.1 phosphatase PAP2 family protein [Xanthomonas cucurbitae]WDM69942.1 phosphatase PAP2 family protein [Xanthomonas cucurbitae]WDM73842.1 phosphatase PAP2 family protein [Xanthomonas cucurbitae]
MSDAPAESPASVKTWLRHNAWRMGLLFVGVLVPLGLFVDLADEVHALENVYFDEPLLWSMRSIASPGLDAFFGVISRLGYQYGVIPLDIAIVLVLLALRRWREGTFAALGFGGSALLNMGAKQFFQRDRPSLWESIAPESTFSFPSGHAMGSMTLAAVVIALAWRTRWRWPVTLVASAFALLVGVSRIYLGVHYPSDILGGWSAALVWVVGLYLAMFRGTRRPHWRGVRAAS